MDVLSQGRGPFNLVPCRPALPLHLHELLPHGSVTHPYATLSTYPQPPKMLATLSPPQPPLRTPKESTSQYRYQPVNREPGAGGCSAIPERQPRQLLKACPPVCRLHFRRFLLASPAFPRTHLQYTLKQFPLSSTRQLFRLFTHYPYSPFLLFPSTIDPLLWPYNTPSRLHSLHPPS